MLKTEYRGIEIEFKEWEDESWCALDMEEYSLITLKKRIDNFIKESVNGQMAIRLHYEGYETVEVTNKSKDSENEYWIKSESGRSKVSNTNLFQDTDINKQKCDVIAKLKSQIKETEDQIELLRKDLIPFCA